jgi:hypothetical protein
MGTITYQTHSEKAVAIAKEAGGENSINGLNYIKNFTL